MQRSRAHLVLLHRIAGSIRQEIVRRWPVSPVNGPLASRLLPSGRTFAWATRWPRRQETKRYRLRQPRPDRRHLPNRSRSF